MIKDNLEQLAYRWITVEAKKVNVNNNYYCQTRDVFQARLSFMTSDLLKSKIRNEEDIYVITAIIGEIGNNSFDHNLGNWPDIPGIFFGHNINNKIEIYAADRGQGILKTLKRVKPELKNDSEALQTAFFEKISGRAPENRGNGLKFVKQSAQNLKINLKFISGNAQAELNNKMKIKQIDQDIKGCLAILNVL